MYTGKVTIILTSLLSIMQLPSIAKMCNHQRITRSFTCTDIYASFMTTKNDTVFHLNRLSLEQSLATAQSHGARQSHHTLVNEPEKLLALHASFYYYAGNPLLNSLHRKRYYLSTSIDNVWKATNHFNIVHFY